MKGTRRYSAPCSVRRHVVENLKVHAPIPRRFSSKSLGDIISKVGEREVLYGTDNGLVGQLFCDPTSIRQGWVVPNMRGLGSVTSLFTYDITKSGQQDIIMARDDGEIQVRARHCLLRTGEAEGERHAGNDCDTDQNGSAISRAISCT